MTETRTETKSEAAFTLAELSQFTGSEQWYRHRLCRRMLYTDGVKYLAERAGAYWLIDEIAFAQALPQIAREEFQVWKLRVEANSADLICEDGNDNAVYRKRIPFTDFPAPGVEIWCANNVIYLPSEH